MADRGSTDHGTRSHEDPQTMGRAVGGAAGVGAGVAVGLATFGPIGAVVGALAGGAGGWWAGKELIQSVEEVDRDDNRFRRAHEHAGATRPYEEVRHAYQIGYLAGRNPEYADAPFSEIERDLSAAWTQAHLHDGDPVPWEDVAADAERGYDLARERG
jgi:phage tail tape-measure protein